MAIGLLRHFDQRRAYRDAVALWRHARWCTTQAMHGAARTIVGRLKSAGIRNVGIIKVPSDGKTSAGGWVMSKAWDVKAAKLTVVDPLVRAPILADYRENPLSLMLWSPPTAPAGITTEVVLVKEPARHRGGLKGKFVLIDNPRQVTIEAVQQLARKGAAGIISDHIVPDPGVKEGAYLDDACQYRNYVIPSWDGARRLPGFSLTPRRGRLLRKLLEENGKVRVHALVRSRLYDGSTPVVTACLPGRDESEIVLTGHMDEPGASDNASGVAVSMEILRALAAYVKRRGEPLERTVRIMFSSEVRGIQGYLNLQGHPSPVVAGLNLDMVGANHQKARSSLYIWSALPTTPSYLDEILCELAREEAKRPPLFRWRISPYLVVDDCQFATHPFNAPMCFVGQPHERTYHTSLDTPDAISASHMGRIGRMALRAVAFAADASYDEISALATRCYRRSAAHVRAGRVKRDEAIRRMRRIWSGLDDLLPDGSRFPRPDEVEDMRRKKLLVRGCLYPKAAFRESCSNWESKLSRGRRTSEPRSAPVPRGRLGREAADLVPVKRFSGYLGWEDLSADGKKKLLRETGLGAGWGPSTWLQMALDLSNGERSIAEICRIIERDGVKVNVATAVRAMRFLEKDGKVEFRRVIGGDDILRAIRRVGIRSGDVVVAHTSLSAFGYVKGGTETMVDSLLRAVGGNGTVAVPTHTESWIGRLPYDPRTSPSRVGAVTNAFLQRRGAKRSLHPTHSVAAIGPMARELLAGHDHTVAPQGREGFWGNFYDANGKVLLMCTLRANTILHAAEVWAGLPYPPTRAHLVKNGRRIEVTVPAMPWHVDHFDRVHDALMKKGLLRSARLGEGTIHSVRARDAVDTAMRLVRRNPSAVLPRGCGCRFCRYVKPRLRGRRRK